MKIETNSPQLIPLPESVAAMSLSPPPVDEDLSCISAALEEIRLRYQGRSFTDDCWMRFNLNRKGYEELFHEIEKDRGLWGYVDDKLHCDFFPSINLFILRRRNRLLGQFIAELSSRIWRELDLVQGASAPFAKEVFCCGSATQEFPDKEYGRHDPDSQFRYRGARYPRVILEISFPDKRRYLSRLAEDYILGSDGNIQAVVCLDIKNEGSKEATLSIWRPHVERNEDGVVELTAQRVTNQVFRDKNGNPNTSGTGDLVLSLRDFATTALTCTIEGQLDDEIRIPATRLCWLLERAEK